MSTAMGRDGPAKEERCRGARLDAASPASDQPPTTSETGFSSVTHPPMVRKPCWTTAEMWSLAYRETGRCGAAVPGPKGWVPREDSAGLFEGRSTLSTGPGRGNQGQFLVVLLFRDGSPPEAASGAGVREPKSSPSPAGGVARALAEPVEGVLCEG